MCDICKKRIDSLDETLTCAGGKKYTYCPNHMLEMLYNGKLELEPDESLTCEVTGKPGAIRLQESDEEEEYVLNPAVMLRLINRSLKPSEYKKLYELKATEEKQPYLIHDDFYTEEGKPVQPVLSNAKLVKLYGEMAK